MRLPPFRHRVVHHALCAVVQPIFEAGFIDHTFANRKGKGTHRAIGVSERYRNRRIRAKPGRLSRGSASETAAS